MLQDPQDYVGNPAQIAALAKMLEKDLAGQDTSEWTQGDFVGQAVLESFKVAKDAIYPDYYKSRHEVGTDPKMNRPIVHHEFGQDYQTKMLPVVYKRLEMAGVRLAFILNQLFAASR